MNENSEEELPSFVEALAEVKASVASEGSRQEALAVTMAITATLMASLITSIGTKEVLEVEKRLRPLVALAVVNRKADGLGWLVPSGALTCERGRRIAEKIFSAFFKAGTPFGALLLLASLESVLILELDAPLSEELSRLVLSDEFSRILREDLARGTAHRVATKGRHAPAN